MSNSTKTLAAACAVVAMGCAHPAPKQTAGAVAPAAGVSPPPFVPISVGTDTPQTDITTMVSRLDLEKYKATIKGLTQFGDRRQGTDRNRAAVDWIEAQLKSYGCTPTARITYDFHTVARTPRPPIDSAARARAAWARLPIVRDSLGVRAAVALELRLDPVHRLAIALRPLPAIAKLRQA
ncbi:MAG: hypothetical protein ACREMU_01460, partial [Gemmatimonadaceae bacterium]